MTTSYYSAGTVTVTNGSNTITGTGTAWQTALITGGNVFVQAIGNPMPIADVVSDTEITSELEWAGATGTYSYRIQRDTAYLKTLDANSQNLAYLLSEMRQGTLFKYDQAGTLAGRDVFDTQPKGFAYLVTEGDDADLYVRASATSGDWAGPFIYGAGPVGPAGPAGFIDYKGDYSAVTAYVLNDGVRYNGSSFVALQSTTGNAPPTLPTTENAYWSLIAIKGADGTGTGDVVGPTGATDGAITAFDGTTGKLVKEMTAAQVRSAIDADLLGGSRNKIINPLGAVNQRGVAGTVTLAAGAYGHDRFKAGAGGCTYTFSTTNGVTTFTIAAGSLQQVIEASAFAGETGTYVLAWVGTAQGRIGSASYGTSGNVSAECNGSADVTVEWSTGTLSLPQFERGFVAEFSARPYGSELRLCRRYFQRSGLLYGGTISGTQALFVHHMIEPMRVTPTITQVFVGIGIQINGATQDYAVTTSYNFTATDAVELVVTLSSSSWATPSIAVITERGVFNLSAEL